MLGISTDFAGIVANEFVLTVTVVSEAMEEGAMAVVFLCSASFGTGTSPGAAGVLVCVWAAASVCEALTCGGFGDVITGAVPFGGPGFGAGDKGELVSEPLGGTTLPVVVAAFHGAIAGKDA